MKARYKLKLGFEDDFEIIDVKLLKVTSAAGSAGDDGETLEWNEPVVDVKELSSFRVKSNVVIGVIGLVLTSLALF